MRCTRTCTCTAFSLRHLSSPLSSVCLVLIHFTATKMRERNQNGDKDRGRREFEGFSTSPSLFFSFCRLQLVFRCLWWCPCLALFSAAVCFFSPQSVWYPSFILSLLSLYSFQLSTSSPPPLKVHLVLFPPPSPKSSPPPSLYSFSPYLN
jgi:hypothetical protein